MERDLSEIAELARGAGTQPTFTNVPGVILIKGDVPRHQLAAVYEPMIGFTVQGKKTISIGNQVIQAPAPSYYVIPADIPATGRVHQGKNGLPYLSVGLRLNLNTVRDLLKDLPDQGEEEIGSRGFAACPAPAEFIGAWVRMLRLLKTPLHISALAPVYEREILYRVLCGPQGWQIRQLCLRSGSAHRIHKTLQSIQKNVEDAIDIRSVAAKAGMAVTTFHRQFKQITGLSPIQFQKQLRLLEARKLLVFEGYSVSDAAFKVGYESASQFNREYSRHFGASPARDASHLREIESRRLLGH